MTGQVFVDETKNRDYILVACTISSHELAATRIAFRELVLHGQNRIHMTKESDSRRRKIATAICCTNIRATIYNAGTYGRDELKARQACLRALIFDLAATDVTRLVL